MSSTRGKLITFEGIECAGKGTQIRLVTDWLRQKDIAVETNHEPGGTLYSEGIRGLLKNPEKALPAIYKALAGHSDYPGITGFTFSQDTDFSRSGQAEMFLYLAARAEYADKALKPILAQGGWFISDRLMDSTIAYQGGGHFHSDPEIIKRIIEFNRFALGGLWPDVTLFLDIPIEVMYERMAGEDDEKNSFLEKKYPPDFFRRTRQEYLNIAAREPERFKIIDGTQEVKEVFFDIISILKQLL